ncbi:NAD(P)/FAD-dependent oxidoreductase [Dietzia sp. PP-33]|jgi:4-hydroxyacetophenone monooxygenase|uniref:flavin-containing monooxygenase n=1 Tax=Dietzia sp. PP-33 TaxID=2957500 RepID=UPI0029AE6FCD|nr:NAD(P)/FAD-dependent oxidoreductase [Dietzia sp. PP-33]MDX2358636.1 NAD(P)/FAD-dependent oxidoreductase [Dietzia sp. PP-33]
MANVTDSDRARLRSAVRRGNVPTMLAVLLELTADERWMDPRYQPTRSRGMDDNSTGGLPDEVQAEIQEALVEAVERWWASGRPSRGWMEDADVERLLNFTCGESIPPDFAPMMAEIVNGPRATPASGKRDERLHAIVIGAGIAGMLASVELTRAGIPHVILEKNDDVGGSWWENRYPGAGVDTPSHLYSITSFPHNWSTHFGKRDEVQGYLEDFAEANDIRRHVRFRHEVTRAEFDDAGQSWRVTVRRPDGESELLVAPILISAVGLLNRPKVPNLPGIESFRGRMFHSAEWPSELDDPDALRGKRVGIVGAGASAMQIGPAIADRVGSLTIFQRSPQWIAPNDDYFATIDDDVHWLLDHVPGYREWYRARLSWIFNDKVYPTLQVDPEWPEPSASINAANHGHRRFYERYLRDQLGDRDDLIEASLPDYPPFGKRMLLDNGWYAMLRKPHVTLVTNGVDAVTPTGLVDSDGVEHELDIIVMATGFHSVRILHPMDIVGRSGRSTKEIWGEHDARAYLGITVPDFPNFFIMTGPNTGLGHGGSFITILECQVRYIMDALELMRSENLGVLECRAEVNDRYNEAVDRQHAQMVWTHPAMENWYRNPDGRVVSVLPWRINDYWSMTNEVDPEDFHTEPVRAGAAQTATTGG